ncbi:hypothetical protein C6P46_003347 [Rhodotorula mucilaginosa]|uniref:Uncharacterized protein n=1 Tax=Rhodotorula mucilaginosa TaxID=5537 RepID=A0A9P6W333_RHOMI|nr:hypothetical protein C6P46_003347 [Rhodotorula mucilaginosa]
MGLAEKLSRQLVTYMTNQGIAAPCPLPTIDSLPNPNAMKRTASTTMTASDAEDDIITLVTSNDPPFELPVERELLRDSRVFSDMFSLPTTSDGDARLNVAETAYELGLWIDFLRSGQVETPDPDAWDHDTDQEVGQDVVRIAKLVDN